ncbi:MAG: transcriptional repressor [Prevotella sp.]|jgi:Fur family ferric uptake transcriptional regulator|nr:transcriptional repressor [Prevotella sp.]
MNAIELLKNKGLKKTAQRIMLINILQKASIALTESDIKAEMGDLYDRITFYRTVQTLLDADIIHRIAVNNVIVKYALNALHIPKPEMNHAHFFCKNCHSVICIGDTPSVEYKLPEYFSVDECEILIKGICANCRNTKKLF